ncbi:MAG: hypothetical protein PHD87_04860 [Candidatus Cloacimonetes bacterium]|nr:hypothetical protein [Candidatus Cloacimonadota bacterium]
MRQKKLSFKDQVAEKQVEWRQKNIKDTRKEKWNNGVEYGHLLPKDIWEQGLWEGIRDQLTGYIKENKIQPHVMKHSLRSSWVINANLYYPIRAMPIFTSLFKEFVSTNLGVKVTDISLVELEFCYDRNDHLHPANLLGERDAGGRRGAGQTSPDIAFIFTTNAGNGIILTECKYTESSFYPCTARREENKGDKLGNPDPRRCLQRPDLIDFTDAVNCHQFQWGRQYWSLLKLSNAGLKSLYCCPAAKNGYQLFRQQALAEGIAKSGRFSQVVSAVAYDAENAPLQGCLKTSGVQNWTETWGKLFQGKAQFYSWTHQDWVQFVRKNQLNGSCQKWLDYVQERYLF